MRFGWSAVGFVMLALAAASPLAAAEPTSWAQTRSDLPVNPAVRFGVLPNGMRYAVLRNGVPAGGVSVRLRIAAGSLYETDKQQGVAHYLEHMAFRGSAHVESGEALKTLERLGLAVGADANAQTGFTETVYKFDIPSADKAKLDTALMLMRETASELSLTDASFEAERPVILSEERGNAGPGTDVGKAQLGLWFAGQRAADRLPIGKVDLLKTMPVTEARQFYHDYYRPERAALIVVGDIDPAQVEAEIKARFADWRNPAPAGPEPDLGRIAAKGPAVRIVTRPGVQPTLSLVWERPYDNSPYDKARRRRDTIEQLAMQVLSRRLFAMAASENSPFSAAGAGVDNSLRSARLTTLQGLIKPDSWQRGLEGLIIAERQITASSGVSQADLDTAIASMRAQLQTRAAGYSTRPSPVLANELTGTLDKDDVFTPDDWDLTFFDDAVKSITPEEVTAAARAAFTAPGPLITLTGTTPVAGGEPAVLAALANAEKMPTSAFQVTAKAWPFTHFGTLAKVTERHHVDDLDITQVRFTNNVRLNVKSTKLRADEVLIQIRFGGGRFALAAKRPPLDWAYNAWIAGGLRGISPAELSQIFAGKVHNESAGVADDAFLLGGSTRPQDFDLELQLLTAYMTAPAWRPDQFDRLRSIVASALPTLDSTPAGVMRRDLGGLLHSGDPRWTPPTLAEAQAIRLEDVRGFVDPALASGQMEVSIVGDVDVEHAIQAVAATLGTLPARANPVRNPPRVLFPAPSPEPVTLHHSGRADQGVALSAWPIPDYYADPQRARTLGLLARIVSLRLFDQVRVAQGATYTTVADAASSNTLPGYGTFLAFAETPPDKMAGFYQTLDAMVADLKAKEVTADELARGRAPELESLTTAQRTNGYWLSRISGSQADPRQLDVLRTVKSGIEKITAADLRRAAQENLDMAKVWRLRILPSTPDLAKVPQ